MKRMITWLAMSLICTAALALPRPSEIEDALATEHYDAARRMVAEVLRARPDSARAHLIDAYLLAHVDHDRAGAVAELQAAASMDKTGDVKSSPLFVRAAVEIDQLARPPAAAPLSLAEPPEQPGNVLAWMLAAIGACVGAATLYACFRRRPAPVAQPASTSPPRSGGRMADPAPSGPGTTAGYAAQHVESRRFGDDEIPHVHEAPAMGVLGTAAAVAGGVVAANMLTDALRQRSSDDDDAARRRRARQDEEDEERRRRDTWPASTYSAPTPAYDEPARPSFSSSSSGSDSWSSSSSSSSDYGSSSDSGSSSSSSDW